MKYDEIKTPDDLRDFVCKGIAKNTSPDLLEKAISDKSALDFVFKTGCVEMSRDLMNESKNDICTLAKAVNDNLVVAKSEYANAVKLVRETRMTVNREVDEMNKSITAFTSRNAELVNIVNSLTQLRELLRDPVLKGILK